MGREERSHRRRSAVRHDARRRREEPGSRAVRRRPSHRVGGRDRAGLRAPRAVPHRHRVPQGRSPRHEVGDIDRDKKLWTLPTTKAGHGDEKPLSDLALSVIDEAKKQSVDRSEYVFSVMGGPLGGSARARSGCATRRRSRPAGRSTTFDAAARPRWPSRRCHPVQADDLPRAWPRRERCDEPLRAGQLDSREA